MCPPSPEVREQGLFKQGLGSQQVSTNLGRQVAMVLRHFLVVPETCQDCEAASTSEQARRGPGFLSRLPRTARKQLEEW